MIKPSLLLLCSIFSLTLFAQKNKKTTDPLQGIDTAIERILKTFNAAGVSVAVVEKDKVIFSKGYGFANVETKTPATANTVYAIGSCTKAFTSSLIGNLNKEGKIKYDEPVRTYIPDVKFFNTELNNNVTLRDMMTHRTGLPRHDISWYLFPTMSRDSMVKRIEFMEPSAPLRERWQYNNFMFLLQGYVTEKLTGKSWEDNIKEQLLTPLGMNKTTVSFAEWMKGTDLAAGYTVKKDSLINPLDYFNINSMAPAGSINSTVVDMAKWVTLWINGGKFNGKEILSSGYVAEASSGQMIVSGALPSKDVPDVFMTSYGFGWMPASYRGHYRVEHGGNIDGFSASTSFFPTDSIGIIVLCNQDGSPVPAMVRNVISDKILGLKYIDWTSNRKKLIDKSKAAAKEAEKTVVKDSAAVHPITHPINDYAGSYNNKGYGTINIHLVHDSLIANMQGNKNIYFKHKNYDLYNVYVSNRGDYDTSEAIVTRFEMNNNGDIDKLSIETEGGIKPIIFERGAAVKTMSKDSLKKYIGVYELSPTATAKVFLKADSVLYLFVPGQPEYELQATGDNTFGIKDLSGYSLKFKTNKTGGVTEVLFIQPNGTFKATKKKE